MKDAHNGKQHKTYPIIDGIISNVFQSVVDIAGIINCFRQVVRFHDCTQLQCGAGVVSGISWISGDLLNLCIRNYRRINAHKP